MSTPRLAWDCPRCGAALVLRTNREKTRKFLGCDDFPACRFSEEYEPRLDAALALMLSQKIDAESLRQSFQDEIRALIFLAHPDRWPGNPLAHELTAALNDLRQRLRKGGLR